MSLSPRLEMLTITTSEELISGTIDSPGDGVGRLERGDGAFEMCELTEGIEGSHTIRGDIFGAALIVQPCLLGSDGRVVESGGDSLGEGDPSGEVLQ